MGSGWQQAGVRTILGRPDRFQRRPRLSGRRAVPSLGDRSAARQPRALRDLRPWQSGVRGRWPALPARARAAVASPAVRQTPSGPARRRAQSGPAWGRGAAGGDRLRREELGDPGRAETCPFAFAQSPALAVAASLFDCAQIEFNPRVKVTRVTLRRHRSPRSHERRTSRALQQDKTSAKCCWRIARVGSPWGAQCGAHFHCSEDQGAL